MSERICGECRYHRYDKDADGAWVCDNDKSDHFAMWTDYTDTCECFEQRGVE